MRKLNPKHFYSLGMKSWSPRWLKIWCLKMILRYVSNEMVRKINSMTPEQRAKFDEAIGRMGA